MTLLVTVMLASAALSVGASPTSPRFARDTFGIISFDMVLPGVRDVPLEEDAEATTTEAAATTTAAPAEMLRLPGTDDVVPVFFMESLPMFSKADKGWPGMMQPEEAPSEEEEAQPEEAQPGEAQPGEAQPGEAQPEEAQPGEAQPKEDVGSGAGSLLFFPTEGASPPSAPKATTEASESSDGFVFPSHISVAASKEEKDAVRGSARAEGECALSQGLVMVNGSCERLLARNHCAKDEWLLLREGAAKCEKRPCPWGEIFFEDRCVNPIELSVCDSGQVLYIDFSGRSVCDCDAGFLYDPWSGNCFARHEKGSCNFGEYVDVSASGMVECVRNPCISNGYVKEAATGLCFRKMYGGFCEDADLLFHRSNRTAECRKVSLHNILDVPELRECPAGSIRDYLNVCRETFHVATLTSYPVLYGGCPGGFVRDPSGTCRKTSRLFGG
nr:uncharacterized protein LOC113800144 isoform X1 [Penaeus vannamei]